MAEHVKLKMWMEEIGCSPKTLAWAIGVHPQAVRSWLSGAFKPRPKHARKLYELSDGAVRFNETK